MLTNWLDVDGIKKPINIDLFLCFRMDLGNLFLKTRTKPNRPPPCLHPAPPRVTAMVHRPLCKMVPQKRKVR